MIHRGEVAAAVDCRYCFLEIGRGYGRFLPSPGGPSTTELLIPRHYLITIVQLKYARIRDAARFGQQFDVGPRTGIAIYSDDY